MNPLRLKEVLHSISFAARVHDGQYRKDKATPYVAHPMRTVIILSLFLECFNHKALILASLHDTYEDQPEKASLDLIANLYGEEMAEYVELISKQPGQSGHDALEAYFEKLRKAPPVVRLVKMADQIDNWFDSFHLPPKQRGYHQEKVYKTLLAIQPQTDDPYFGEWQRTWRLIHDNPVV